MTAKCPLELRPELMCDISLSFLCLFASPHIETLSFCFSSPPSPVTTLSADIFEFFLRDVQITLMRLMLSPLGLCPLNTKGSGFLVSLKPTNLPSSSILGDSKPKHVRDNVQSASHYYKVHLDRMIKTKAVGCCTLKVINRYLFIYWNLNKFMIISLNSSVNSPLQHISLSITLHEYCNVN